MHESAILDTYFAKLNGKNEWSKELLGTKIVGDLDLDTCYASIPRTELTTAREIGRVFKNIITYVTTTDTWYIWNGTIHVPCDDDGIVLKVVQNYYDVVVAAIAMVDGMIEAKVNGVKASGLKDADKKAIEYRKQQEAELRKHKKFRDNLSSNSTQNAVVTQLKRIMDVPRDHYEQDNQFFVVRNGVIDLADFKATGTPTLLPHDPARAVYRYFDADFNEQATCPNWRGFLKSSIIDEDTATLLQKGVGAAFAATYKPRAMFNLLGAPASGKSLFLSVFDKLGQDYAVMPNNQAIQQSGNDTNFYQEALRGQRFIGFSEVQGKKPLDDGFIKGVMGGDKQNTRTLHARERAWTPQGVMFVASNMALKIDFRDEATFNKVLPIPFPWSFTDTDPLHKMDRDLEDKVLAERDGVLIWVLQGMKLFWERGLEPTAAVLEAMSGNKVANSYALQFIRDMIDGGLLVEDLDAPKSSFIKIGDAYKAFGMWCTGQGAKSTTGKHTFGEDIKSAYHGDANSGGRRFNGLSMTPALKQMIENDATGAGGISLSFHMINLDERVSL